jgi:hypothetical protein
MNTKLWDRSQVRPTSPNLVLNYLIFSHRGTGPRLGLIIYFLSKNGSSTAQEHLSRSLMSLNLAQFDEKTQLETVFILCAGFIPRV